MSKQFICAAVFSAIFLATGIGCKPSATRQGTIESEPTSPPKTEVTPTEVTPTEVTPTEVTPTEVSVFKVKYLDAAAASDLVDENSEVVVLDVRTPEEFAGGHIQGALNIDFKSSGFRDEIAKLDPGKTYLIHCRSGGRSTSSLPVFEESGFTGIHHLDGGFDAWKAGGNAYVTD